MKSLVLGKRKAILENVNEPQPRDEWVVAKVIVSPICGSDKQHFYSNTPIREAGHEGAGEIVAVDKSSRLCVGDKVILNPLSGCGTCQYCLSGDYIYCPQKPNYYSHFAQYVLIQDFVCSPIPKDISYDNAALACCTLGPAFGVYKRMNLNAFDTLLITGLGPVGLGAVALAKFLGARVIALDLEQYRLDLACELGADKLYKVNFNNINILKDSIIKTSNGGPTKALDCSGHQGAQRFCIDIVKHRGYVGWVGENHGYIPVNPSEDFRRKGLTLLSSWHYNLNDLSAILEFLRRSKALSKIITHRLSIDKAQSAFEIFDSGKCGKVFILPWD